MYLFPPPPPITILLLPLTFSFSHHLLSLSYCLFTFLLLLYSLSIAVFVPLSSSFSHIFRFSSLCLSVTILYFHYILSPLSSRQPRRSGMAGGLGPPKVWQHPRLLLLWQKGKVYIYNLCCLFMVYIHVCRSSSGRKWTVHGTKSTNSASTNHPVNFYLVLKILSAVCIILPLHHS